MKLTKHRHGLTILWGDRIAHKEKQWRCAVYARGYAERMGNVATWKLRTPAEQIMWTRNNGIEEPTWWLSGTMDALAGAGQWSWQQRDLESWVYLKRRKDGLALIQKIVAAVDGLGGYAED